MVRSMWFPRVLVSTPNKEEIEKSWAVFEEEMKKANKSEEEIACKKGLGTLRCERIVKPDSFDFTIESVGPFEETSIVKKAINVMKDKLAKFKQSISEDGVVSSSTTTIPNSFDILLKGEDYTLGKVLEFILYRDYYERSSNNETIALNYCGFKKPHPHIDLSVIRFGFVDDNITEDDVRNLLDVVCITATNIYSTIEKQFISDDTNDDINV